MNAKFNRIFYQYSFFIDKKIVRLTEIRAKIWRTFRNDTFSLIEILMQSETREKIK